jgi:hypothetical protein
LGLFSLDLGKSNLVQYSTYSDTQLTYRIGLMGQERADFPTRSSSVITTTTLTTNSCRTSLESYDEICFSTASRDGSGSIEMTVGSSGNVQEALYAGDLRLAKVRLKPAARDGAMTSAFLAWVRSARLDFLTSMYFSGSNSSLIT